MHPHLGIRGAWIDQKAKVTYQGGGIVTGAYTVNLKNDFSGGGLKAGLDARYQIGPGGALFTDLNASLLYGNFNVKQIQNQAGVAQINLDEKFHRIAPSLQMILGVSWDWNCCWPVPMLFALSAAAEGQYWWRQNQTSYFIDSEFPIHVKSGDDLGLFGFNLRADFFF